MVRALRGSRARAAVVTVTLSALLSVTLSFARHNGSDDPLCGGAFVAGGSGLARLTAERIPAEHTEHCVLCHAAQTEGAPIAATYHAPAVPAHLLVSARPTPAVESQRGSRRPARAPPRA